MRFKFLGLAALAAFAAAPLAAHAEESSVTLYSGATHVEGKYADRYYGGVFANVYAGDLGIHVDAVDVSREENVGFASMGLSYPLADGVRAQVNIGSSTHTDNIAPDIYASSKVDVKFAENTVTPRFTYRHFRNGLETFEPALDGVRYFRIAGDHHGYYALQGHGSLSFLRGQKTSYSIGGGVQTVRESGLSLGVNGEWGRMAYGENVLSPGINTKFWAVRPMVGQRLGAHGPEVFVRGEYIDAGVYNGFGGMLGIKFHLSR